VDPFSLFAVATEWLTVTVGGALRFLMPFLILSGLMLGPVGAGLMLLWVRALHRALRNRRQFMIVPTSRTESMQPRNFNLLVRGISQVRLRRRNTIMSPAGAVRIALTNANKLTVVHSMGGPPWMAGVLDVNNVAGVMVAPVELVDPAWISPKSILPPVWVDPDADAPTMPVGSPTRPLPKGPDGEPGSGRDREPGARAERAGQGAGTRETPDARPDRGDGEPPGKDGRRRDGGDAAGGAPGGATGLGLGVARARRRSA
jgi:hypothetical protein